MPHRSRFPGCNSEPTPAHQQVAHAIRWTQESFRHHAGQGLQETAQLVYLLGFLRVRTDELHSIAISGSLAHDPANPNREPGEGWCELDGNFPSHFQLDPGGHSHASIVEFVSAAIVQLGLFRTLNNDPDGDIKSMARSTPRVEQGADFIGSLAAEIELLIEFFDNVPLLRRTGMKRAPGRCNRLLASRTCPQ